jgi:hypothetical protein
MGRSSRWRNAAWLVAMVAITAAGSLFLGSAASATNLIANGTFEGSGAGSLSGWASSGGALSLVAGHGGGHAARNTASGTAKTYAYTSSKPVKSATAGAGYTLNGFVRSDAAGQTVCLVLKETPSGGSSTVGSAQQCVTTTTAWQAFPAVSYTVKTTGDSLTVNVSEASPASRSFDIDDVSLVAGGGGGGSGDTTPPSVPQNLQAGAPTASAVNLTWDASTDDTGVTGYDIFRNGSKLDTVGGAATSYQDASVAGNTPYTYTVDAFDAAGNISAKSAPASVTTPSGGGGGGGVPCGTAAQSTRPYAHIVVIMDENITYASWKSSPDAVYTHALGSGCRLLTNAAGETHPSFPNYLAVASGSFQTCLACSSSADNIFHQLNQSGGSWRDYNQSMPKNCAANTSSVPQYRDGHNPAFWFTDLGSGGDGSCAKFDVPADPTMWNDIAADRLPSFAWIAPDDCYDMHWMTGTCESVTGGAKADRIKIGDAYIKRVVQAVAATPSYQAGDTLIVVTWDESNEGSVLNKGNWGMDCSTKSVYDANVATCQVPTILVSARIPAGPDGAFYSHYSLTRAFEENFGLPLLGGATRVTSAPIY